MENPIAGPSVIHPTPEQINLNKKRLKQLHNQEVENLKAKVAMAEAREREAWLQVERLKREIALLRSQPHFLIYDS